MTDGPVEEVEEVIDLPEDSPPKDGRWADWEGAQLDPETVEEGNRLGETIDPDNDDDNGGVE